MSTTFRTTPPLNGPAATVGARATRRSSWRRSKLAMTVVAALAGGSVMSTCETRIKDAVIDGSKGYLFNTLLSPTAIIDLMSGDTTDPEE